MSSISRQDHLDLVNLIRQLSIEMELFNRGGVDRRHRASTPRYFLTV
jgi:hypothetical protein